MRAITIQQLVLEELNRQLAQEGREVCVVSERPRPQLVARGGEVIPLRDDEGVAERDLFAERA
jgi:hypothetical protein